MCRDIIPAMLKPRARVEYVEMGGEDLFKKQDVVRSVRTILRGIKCKIDVGGTRNRTPKYKAATIGQARATTVAMMTAAAADATETVG